MISDKELYGQWLAGDRSAFEALVLRHRHSLICFITQILNNYHSAEDLSQDVFAHIYMHKDAYDSQYEFRTYLFLLGRHKAYDYLRAHKRHSFVPLDEVELETRVTLEEQVFGQIDRDEIAAAMGELNKDYRTVLVLFYWYQMPLQEIGSIMGKSQNNMKVLVHRARKKLGETLVERGIQYEIG